MFTSLKKLEEEISNEKFLFRGSAFIEEGTIHFANKKEAKNFLVKFLLLESIAGTPYTRKEFMAAYRKVKRLSWKKFISSENIPVLPPKTPADKVLCNVIYCRKNNVCTYKKDCA